VISVLTLTMAAGASPAEAAMLSNYAAGIVVGEVGTATLKTAELEDAIRNGIRVKDPRVLSNP
jgi:D-beta-D-heptose 7-phosphate kinase/D-beta-D-heptose 1-phosphate adenosyltransferase